MGKKRNNISSDKIKSKVAKQFGEIDRASEEMQKGHYTSAIEILNNVIESNIELSLAYYFRSICKYELNDFEGALLDIEEAYINNVEDEWRVYLLYSHLNCIKGNYKKAKTGIDKALKIDSNNSDVLLHYGKIQYQEGEKDDALIYFNKSIDQDNKNYLAFALRGLLFSEKNEKYKALSEFEKIPEDQTIPYCYVLIGKGILAAHEKNYFAAMQYYDDAIFRKPNIPTPYLFRGLLKIELRDTSAEDDLFLANQVGGILAGRLELSIHLYCKSIMIVDIKRAKHVTQICLDRDPNSSVLLETLSAIEYASGNYRKSLDNACNALKNDETNKLAWIWKAYSQMQLGYVDDEVSEDMKSIKKIFGDDSFVYYMAAVYATPLDSEIQKEYVQLAYEKDPNNPLILTLLAAIKQSDGAIIDAEELFKKAKINGSYYSSDEMLAYSKELTDQMKISTIHGGINKSDKNTKELLEKLILEEFKDKVTKGQTVKGTIQIKIIERMQEKYNITLKSNSLRTYLSRLEYSSQREHSSDLEYSNKYYQNKRNDLSD